MRRLDLDEAGASALRVRYWQAYGATLLGLVRHHGVDPHEFLHATHDTPELARMVVREAGLRHALRRLPGRRILFSNSPLHYAEAVLGALGVADLFDAVYCIEKTAFRPKPDPAGFRAILRRERLAPASAIMVEDMLENLVAARRLGMKTAWITRETRRPGWLTFKAASVTRLPRLAAALGMTR
jgi:putative hydrolase of the HAD superfamily